MWKRQLNELYELVTEGLPVALFMVDEHFLIFEFNPQAEVLTGWKLQEVIGRPCHQILGSSLCKERCPLKESREKQTPIQGRRATIHRKDGTTLPIIFASSAQCNPDGSIRTGVELFRDATHMNRLEEQRKNLISLFTHDLKSPVSIAGGLLDRLKRGKAGSLNDKQLQYIRTAHQELSRLEDYISSFLEVSCLESGRMVELRPQRFDSTLLLQEIIESFREQAAHKSIDLVSIFPSDLPSIEADRGQLGRILANLIDNAIKYSKATDRVLISIEHKEKELIFSVQDHGPGISPTETEHVFDYFHRIPDQRGKVVGTGLGLASVRAISRAHGGRVWLESVLGAGCTFYVALPIHFSPADSPQDP
jgi:two-component system phosphate regulon sensor histidine kinase PhoR